MLDITTIGEVLIDLTQTGCSEQGVPLFAAYPGGAPANVAVAAAKLGASTAFVGKTGQDEFGSYLRRVLAEHGVDVTGLHTDRSPTSLAVVSVSPGGERSFRFMRGADTNLSPDEIDEGWVDRSKVLHFGSVSLTAGMSRSATIFAARRAHKTGKLVSYDPNYRPSLWRGREEAMQWLQIPLPLAGLVKMSQEELPLLTGSEDLERGSQILEDMGIRLVVVTLGDRGAFYRWRGRTGLVPGVDVEAVDTNGAGDTFLGALLYRLTRRGDSPLEGLTVSELEEALDFSNRAAALTCTRSPAPGRGPSPPCPPWRSCPERGSEPVPSARWDKVAIPSRGAFVMQQFTYTITDPIGLHARPAGLLVRAARALDSTVTIRRGDRSVSAVELMNLMSMGVRQGEQVTVTIEGGDEEASRRAMEQFFQENL